MSAAAAVVLAAVVSALAGANSGTARAAAQAVPQLQSPPTISGTPRSGSTLTASPGIWTPTPSGYKYQWRRCDTHGHNCQDVGPTADVTAATSSKYTLTDADIGNEILISVIAYDHTDASATAYSVPVTITGQAPENTSPPTIVGTARVGSVLDTKQGNWLGPSISYSYEWLRCDTKGQGCGAIKNATSARYQIANDDLGHTLVVVVTGKNQYGSASANSAATAVVVLGGGAPVSTSRPLIAGTMRAGQTVTASPGGWQSAGAITGYAYQWQRCDTKGAGCTNIDGATNSSYKLTDTDVGHTVRIVVTATSAFGTGTGYSYSGAVIQSASGGTTPIPPGGGPIPVTSVALPDRLVISGVKFSPRRLTTRSPFVARFRVTDTRGRPVSGAFVFALALPYGQIRKGAELPTGGDGWVQFTFTPTRKLSLRRGALVFFVRARKPNSSILGGVSTRRLVQVRVGR